MSRLALTLLLTGCPASLEHHDIADCCSPSDAGCDWEPLRYSVPSIAKDFATDEGACKRAGLEPYR